MTMAPFDELFPDLARDESRTITVFDHDRLLPGSYLLREVTASIRAAIAAGCCPDLAR